MIEVVNGLDSNCEEYVNEGDESNLLRWQLMRRLCLLHRLGRLGSGSLAAGTPLCKKKPSTLSERGRDVSSAVPVDPD